jgi:hypothetical protein
MPKPIILSALIKGAERKLFSVQERSQTDDITIVLKRPVFSTDGNAAPYSDLDRIREERISVHCSPGSPTNGIKYTLITEGEQEKNTYQYTTAIKQYNQFAFVIMRRNGDLSNDRYVIKADVSQCISLGEYDPTYF